MNGDSPRKPWIAAIVGLMLLVGLAVGFTSYQAGVSRGLALQPPPPPVVAAQPNGAAPQAAPAPYYYPRYRAYRGWGGFGFFGGLFSILIWIFVIRLIFRALFGWGWGCGWGWRRRYWGGYGYGPHPDDYDDWHRRAHDRMREQQGSTPPPTTA